MRMPILAVISYVADAPLTVHVSMNLAETHWLNIWTYFFWAFSICIWSFILSVLGIGSITINYNGGGENK